MQVTFAELLLVIYPTNNMKTVLIWILGIILMFHTNISEINAENTINIRTINGLEESFLLSGIRKITFSENEIRVVNFNNTFTTFAVSDLNKMFFTGTTSEIAETTNSTKFYIYPNPAKNFVRLVIQESEVSTASIYNLSGSLLIKKPVSIEDNEIDISNLSVGVYLLKVGNKTDKLIVK